MNIHFLDSIHEILQMSYEKCVVQVCFNKSLIRHCFYHSKLPTSMPFYYVCSWHEYLLLSERANPKHPFALDIGKLKNRTSFGWILTLFVTIPSSPYHCCVPFFIPTVNIYSSLNEQFHNIFVS